jgi:hypothetical protein
MSTQDDLAQLSVCPADAEASRRSRPARSLNAGGRGTRRAKRWTDTFLSQPDRGMTSLLGAAFRHHPPLGNIWR